MMIFCKDTIRSHKTYCTVKPDTVCYASSNEMGKPVPPYDLGYLDSNSFGQGNCVVILC